jgi:cytoskeletal protein CcmA (bactofilin family)
MRALVLATLLCLATSQPAFAQEAAWSLVKAGVFDGDLYLAGAHVELSGEMRGDVFAAGRTVAVDGHVQSDLFAAGGAVALRGRMGDDVRAAGGLVTVDAAIRDALLVAGEVVRVSAGARIGGPAWLAGRRLDIAGRLGGELRAAAARIRISGTIRGNVVLAARDIEIEPTAQIEGSLTYWSGQEARIDPGARIRGAVLHRQPEFLDRAGRVATVLAAVTRVVFVVNLLAAGVILFLLFPDFTVAAARTVGREPWKSLGAGVGVLVCTGVAVALLVTSVVGLPLGLALIAFLALSLLLGVLTFGFFLGDLGARLFRRGPELSAGWRLVSLAGAAVALALIRFLPVAGNAVLALALLAGLGAWTLHAWRAYTAGEDDEEEEG